MKALCFGSLNIDYTYSVKHFAAAGETVSSSGLNTYSGGKGLNQSVALARAGAQVYHAGAVGEEGKFLIDELNSAGVDTSFIQVRKDIKTGHAIIQRDKKGENCILLFGGANQSITEAEADEVLAAFTQGDYLILQNEINALPYILGKASKLGMVCVLNPSPMNEKIFELPLEAVDLFIVNELEAAQLLETAGGVCDKEETVKAIKAKFPNAAVLMTLGADGSVYYDGNNYIEQQAYKTEVRDTTAAGDTFTGYFIAALMRGGSISEAMNFASKASSIAVSRHGASPSIPKIDEVMSAMD